MYSARLQWPRLYNMTACLDTSSRGQMYRGTLTSAAPSRHATCYPALATALSTPRLACSSISPLTSKPSGRWTYPCSSQSATGLVPHVRSSSPTLQSTSTNRVRSTPSAMPPRAIKTGPPCNRANSPFYPAADTTTFKDLLLFEERLKMNAQMLRKRKRRYEVFLAVLVGFIVLLAHRLVFDPPEHTFWRYLAQGTLAVALVTLVLFFASGMYEERIRYANRYVPHANKSLRTINMHLNMRRPTFSLVPARFRSLPTPPPPPIAPSKRTTSSVIPPIPPTNNPRGELIFSNRVDRNFKEGYERYRAAFERRREERLKETSTGRRWGWFRRPSPAKVPGSRPSPAVSRRDTPPPGEKRTPSPSRINGRSQSPSTGSKLRPCEEDKPVIPIHVYQEHTGDKGNRGRAESYSFVFSGTERMRPGA